MDDHEDEAPSKSQIKREMHALRDLGERITQLSPAERRTLPLGTRMQAALVEFDRLRAREARRRHLSFIGKLMREEDLDAVRTGLEMLDAASALHARALHSLEAWRDALIESDDHLAAFIDRYPEADRPHLRNLIRSCRRSGESEPSDGARRHYRELFRTLRETVQQSGKPAEPPPG
ncbi:MAG: DUF615 domain-containing protein [Gammaproteobacteria bacterium]|nr:DUF615 domain-containing protein [Gammaproteobacteria bacterium]